MKLHTLLPPYGGKKRSKRVGRGNSSGRGNYSGKGMGGEKSRSGRTHYLGFEGGQMPLYRRLPKRGFTPLARLRYQEVNLYSLNIFKNEKEITPEMLYKEGLIKKKDGRVKILGGGNLELTLTVKAHKFSKRAKDEIVKKGGKTVEVGEELPVGKEGEIKKQKEIKKEIIKETDKDKKKDKSEDKEKKTKSKAKKKIEKKTEKKKKEKGK